MYYHAPLQERPDVYDVILVGSGPANIFAAAELIKTKPDLNILMLEKSKRLNDTRNVSNGWFGGCSRALVNLVLDSDVGGSINDPALIKYIVESIESLTGPLKASRPKILKKTFKRFEENGVELRELNTLTISEDKMIKLGEWFYKLLKENITVIHKSDISSITKVDDVFEVAVEDDSFKTHNLMIGTGRSGATWFENLDKNFELDYFEDYFEFGFRVEAPSSIFHELYSKNSSVVMYFDEFKVSLPTVQGAVETEEAGKLKLSNGRTLSASRGHNCNFSLLKKVYSPHSYKEVSRLIEITNVLCDDQLWKDSVFKFATGNTALSPIREIDAMRQGVKTLTTLFPDLLTKGWLYGPEARLNCRRYLISEDFEASKVKGLFLLGDISGYTNSFLQAASSGIKAARSLNNSKEMK